jgi:hypothetical protein
MKTSSILFVFFIASTIQSCSVDRDPIEPRVKQGSGGAKAISEGTSQTTDAATTGTTDFGEGGSFNTDQTVDRGGGGSGTTVNTSGTGGTGGKGGRSAAGGVNGKGGVGGTTQPHIKDAAVDQPDASATDAAQQVPVIEDVVTSKPVAYGDWDYYEVEGAVCRDGSPAGYYLRKGSSPNLLIFLNGGGVCYDEFFCLSNPANVDQTVAGESLADVTVETFTQNIRPQRQEPPEEGMLKKDRQNPLSDWSMVFIPYCTGDVYAGTLPDAPVFTSPSMPPQQFMGYSNIGLFYRSFGREFLDSEKVVLAGSSAGGFGALLSFERTYQFFYKSALYLFTDSGFPFSDAYLEPCLQKNWRQLWGIDKILPIDCAECFHADGGGIAEGLGRYIIDKYGDRALGGGISSLQDEVMKLFFSAGLGNCTEDSLTLALNALRGQSEYPRDRYPGGLTDFFDNIVGRDVCGSYIVNGSTHQHLFRPRFYETNGVGTTLAEWVGQILDGHAVHVGLLN